MDCDGVSPLDGGTVSLDDGSGSLHGTSGSSLDGSGRTFVAPIPGPPASFLGHESFGVSLISEDSGESA